MAECKDCIHFCVCSPYTAPNESYPEVDGCKCFRATADVVPKSEVERLEGELIVESTRRKNAVNAYHDAKAEVAREVFEEIDALFVRFYDDPSYSSGELGYDIAELKKKYTE